MRISRTFIVAIILLIGSLGISAILEKITAPTTIGQSFEQKLDTAKKDYNRVICYSPVCTEIAFAIGAEDKIVGVGRFCDWPIEAKEKPGVGDSMTINSEQIFALKPDLIIIDGKAQKLFDFCQNNNIEILRLDLMDIDELYNGILIMGKKLDRDEGASKLCGKIFGELMAVTSKVAELKKRDVFICLYRQPGSLSNLSTIGGNTVISEIIGIAGGNNIFSDLDGTYDEISKEALLRRNPEIIIDPQQVLANEETQKKLLKDWAGMGTMSAVKNQWIHFPQAYPLLIPGIRIGESAMEFAKMIHPEAFLDE